jgi:protein-tyrosine phosphatase
MALSVPWQQHPEPPVVAGQAAAAILEGQIVALPTETVYGLAANALSPAAVERLVLCKGRPEDKPLTLAFGSVAEALSWTPQIGKIGRRFARRCWPGPLTLVVPAGADLSKLPDEVRARVSPNGSLGLRVPAHDAILDTLDLLPGPLVLTSANRSGEPDALSGQQVIDTLGDAIQLVIDAGPTPLGKPSTVVRVEGEQWQVLREGALPTATLAGLTGCVILFVCTGNTCRSPLAEALCKKLLAEQLACAVHELPQRGYSVHSAGIAAYGGGSAAPEAIAVAQARGADLAEHVSQPLTPELLSLADFIFGMTRSHARGVALLDPEGQASIDVLAPDGSDLDDPIGCDRQVYETCADQIETWLRQRLPMLTA